MAELESKQWKRSQQTSLWKRTLGSDDEDVKPLRESFLDARKNAAFLLDKIRPDFPNLTIHDITHVDSLWSVADAIIGEDYPINPLEGYVLGIAFLIHDAALSYYSVGGKEKLRNTIEWRDAHAEGPGDKSEEEFEKECDFIAIRALHADNAKNLLSESFKDQNSITINIHGNDSYLNHYGNLIGRIAASHHWDIEDVESKLKKQVNPMSGMPKEWKINGQKLACILRCADAGHIDDGRAPDSIYKSLDVNGVSRNHWESQNHLAQVCEDENDKTKLCITSSYPFKKEEFAAWNVAYDAVRIFDEELKKSNNLLIANHIKEFPHNGVSGASSKEDLAKYIETDGWQPCNFGVHTSNIKYLIDNLGGSKLYGEEYMLLVALRELIQNARDAIHARHTMDESFDYGRITIIFKKEGTKRIIEVEDNGIGMSMDCIKHSLLDFGSSYWKSSLSKYENPGLRSKGFKSIGQFGIGFYSVFMVANSVEVITKRYNRATDDARRVEFPEGLTLSPIISKCELNSSASTIIRFSLKEHIKLEYSIKNAYEKVVDTVPLPNILSLVVAGLDCDVYYHDKCIHRDITSPLFDKIDWFKSICIKITEESVSEVEKIAQSLEEITDEEGNIRGLIFIYDNDYEYNKGIHLPSIVTVGGLLAYRDNSISSIWSMKFSDLENTLLNGGYGFIGYLDCAESGISRNKVKIDEPLRRPLNEWIKRKYCDNYYYIKDSNDLSQYYIKFFTFINLDVKELDKLLKHNTDAIFSDNLPGLSDNNEIMTVLKDIHKYLFSGIKNSAGVFRNGVQGYYSDASFIDDEEDDDRVNRLKQMPECGYNEIISKYMCIMEINPFSFGCDLVAGIWVNIKLYSLLGKMINWSHIDMKDYFRMFGQFDDNSKTEQLCDYLKGYLEEGNKDVFSSITTTGYW